jgi:hypothetical protein
MDWRCISNGKARIAYTILVGKHLEKWKTKKEVGGQH